jgi:hypothetical protein
VERQRKRERCRGQQALIAFYERPPVRPITGGRFACQDIVRVLKPFTAGTDEVLMSETSWLKTSPWGERRAGERFTVSEPMLLWRAAPAGSRRSDERTRTSGQHCRFLDVSSIGALLLAPADNDLYIDSEVLLGHEGELSRVRIARIEPYNSSFSFYGVLFVDLGEHLQQFIDTVTARRRAQTSA